MCYIKINSHNIMLLQKSCILRHKKARHVHSYTQQFSNVVFHLHCTFPTAYFNISKIFTQYNDLCSEQILSCSMCCREEFFVIGEDPECIQPTPFEMDVPTVVRIHCESSMYVPLSRGNEMCSQACPQSFFGENGNSIRPRSDLWLC